MRSACLNWCTTGKFLNTDSHRFGGSNMGMAVASTPRMCRVTGRKHSIAITLPPLAVLAFQAGSSFRIACVTDAIVIGGGHNGLVTAAYLAKGGKERGRAGTPGDCSAAARSPKNSGRL